MKKLLIGLGIALLIGLHFVLLTVAPPGFFVDEAATGAHVVSMLQHGTNAHGQAWPLFSASLGGGYTTPVYLYPLVAWSALFGTNELALRSFSMFVGMCAVLLIGYTIHLWLGKKAGVVATFVGLLLPWAWLQSSLAWDPALVPLVTALAFWAFSVLVLQTKGRARLASHVILPLALVSLAYLYPPMRVGAPLLFLLAYGYLLYTKRISVVALAVTCAGAAVVALPLAQFILQPDALGRSQELSVFHNTSTFNGLGIALANFLAMLNPLFLFATGDPNLRHATGIQGMLGVAALVPVAAVIVVFIMSLIKKHRLFSTPQTQLLVVALCGASTSLLGSALTNEGQPHSLRACAAWVFFVIIIAIGWQLLAQAKHRRALLCSALIIAGIGTLLYVSDLAVGYPQRSAQSFDVSQRAIIIGGHTIDDYPSLAQDYYQKR